MGVAPVHLRAGHRGRRQRGRGTARRLPLAAPRELVCTPSSAVRPGPARAPAATTRAEDEVDGGGDRRDQDPGHGAGGAHRPPGRRPRRRRGRSTAGRAAIGNVGVQGDSRGDRRRQGGTRSDGYHGGGSADRTDVHSEGHDPITIRPTLTRPAWRPCGHGVAGDGQSPPDWRADEQEQGEHEHRSDSTCHRASRKPGMASSSRVTAWAKPGGGAAARLIANSATEQPRAAASLARRSGVHRRRRRGERSRTAPEHLPSGHRAGTLGRRRLPPCTRPVRCRPGTRIRCRRRPFDRASWWRARWCRSEIHPRPPHTRSPPCSAPCSASSSASSWGSSGPMAPSSITNSSAASWAS